MIRIIFLFFFGYSICFSNTIVDPREFDYTEVDSLLLRQTSNAFENPQKLAEFINENFTTDHERFRAIFIWVTNNIQYNCGLQTANANEVFKARKAVCNGYAELLTLLCTQCNITCRKIAGIAKNDESFLEEPFESTNHAWNIVTLNGIQYLTDATWAASSNHNLINEEYFLPPPSSFILNHFPENQQDQLLTIPVSKNDFCSAPVFFSKSINYEVTSFSPPNGNIKIKKGKQITFSFAMNYQPNKVDVDLYRNIKDKNPISTAIIFTLIENKLSFPLVFDTPGIYLMYIQMDFTDAICYKVEVLE